MSINNIWAKGSGSSAVLLTGDKEDQLQFIQLKIESQKICLSGLFAVSIDSNQNVHLWGTFSTRIIMKPELIKIKEKVYNVECGWAHALLKVQRGIYGFGDNSYGQIGHQYKGYILEPVLITQMEVSEMVAGFRQSYWTDTHHNIYGCGQSKNYQLGIKQQHSKNIMKIKKQDEYLRIRKMCTGKKYLLILSQDNEVYGLGSNDHQCLCSDKSVIYCEQLTLIQNNIIDLCSGWSHIVMLDKLHRVLTRGRNNFGQLGKSNNEDQQQFVEIPEKCVSVSSGTEFSFAVGESGTLYGWGWNEHMNIINSQQHTINQPRIISTPGNKKVIKCTTYPAITLIQI